MTQAAKTFDDLSLEEKILHVQELWDRIAAEPEKVPVPKAQLAELRRRLAAHRQDPADVRSWEEVRDRLRGEK